MIPHERSLVKKFENQPFAIIGVNTDSAERYAEEVAELGVTWRSFMGGSTTSRIPARWNVTSYPTIYVIDHKGVIRAKNVRGEQLESWVDRLVEEARTER